MGGEHTEGVALHAVNGEQEEPPRKQDEDVTVDRIVDRIGFGRYQARLLVLCGAGWAADIMDIQALSFLIPKLKREWGVSSAGLGLAASFTFIGMLLGSLVWGVMSDRKGRKISFTLTSLWAGFFGMLAATASNVESLVLWRFLQGFGLGGNLAIDFSLFMEFVPTCSRGKATTLLTIFATVGSLTASGLAWALLETAGWQTFLILCSCPGIIIAFFRSQMLESPYFLAETGRDEESLRVLKEVARFNGYNQELLGEGGSIKKTDKIPLRVVIKSLSAPHVRDRLVATSCLWFALSYGFYGFNVWGPSYFDARGFKPQNSYQALFTSVACQIPGTLSATFLVERWGRRVLIILFSLGCFLSISGVALFEQAQAMVLFTLVLNFNTAALWAVIYTYTPEIFPTQLRTSAMGVCSAIARISGILVSYLGGAFLHYSVSASLLSYALSYALVLLVAAFFLRVDMTGVPLSHVFSHDEPSYSARTKLAESDVLADPHEV